MSMKMKDAMLTRRVGLVGIVFLLMVPALITAQPTPVPVLPDTEAGKRVAMWIAAFNTGSDVAMREYLADNLTPEAIQRQSVEERLGMFRDMRDAFGTAELRKVVKAEEGLVTVVFAIREGFVELSFEFEAQPPHRLLRIFGEPTDDPDQPPPQKMSESQAVTAIEKAVADAAAADQFSGTVLVAHDGKPLILKAWGLASVEHNAPNRTDTKYNLGSINKIFTRLAIGQLAQDGKLSFADTLGKILPDYPNAEARRKITVRQLINMRSGIGDFFGERFDATPKNRFRTNGDYLPMFAADTLAFEPGSQRRYSNGGYAVLGAIIEKVSGQSYYDFVREHIFVPASMTNTESYDADVPVPNLAEGYTYLWGPGEKNMPGPRRKNIYSRPARGSAAGGGYSTAEDLLRFTNAVLADKLLTLPYTDWYLSGQEPGTGTPPPRSRGDLGWNGGAPGIGAVFEADLATGYTVILLTNYDPDAVDAVAKTIRRILSGVIQETRAGG
jgi:CubicO group peptidase (beta-lactamase class C family)